MKVTIFCFLLITTSLFYVVELGQLRVVAKNESARKNSDRLTCVNSQSVHLITQAGLQASEADWLSLSN